MSWLKDQVNAAGAKGIVMGLSGGIDSCVAAVLAKQAVGADRLLCLILPCQSAAGDTREAKMFARRFGIKAKTIDLSNPYNSLIKILPPAGSLARSNLKPRLRMLALYYFANKYNYLVCGTGNKSELKAGYFTKFGDGGADILPIAGLLKKDVIKLARQLRIPENIILKPPTAGLYPGQTDEGEMGITYAALDDILERMEQGRRQTAPKAQLKKVKQMMLRSEHKRQGPKICCL